MASASPTGASSERPDDLDLAAQWQVTAAQVDAHRSSVRATVVVPQRLTPVLRSVFGRYLREDECAPPDGRGRVRVVVGAHLVRGLAAQLAGFGADVEVLDHPQVRAELARIGAELVQAHGGAERS